MDNIKELQNQLNRLKNEIKIKEGKVAQMEASEKQTGTKSFLKDDLKKELEKDKRAKMYLQNQISKAKKDKMNDKYNEFKSKFVGADGKVSAEKVSKEISEYDEKIESINKVNANLEKEIEGKQATLERLGEEGKAKVSAEIENAKKQIQSNNAEIKRLENQKANLEKNSKGYEKYKDQIEKIKNYEQRLNTKLKDQIKVRNESSKKISKAKKELNDITKKLGDENFTNKLDNNQYNALLENKEKLEKIIKEQTPILDKAKAKILDLQSKINMTDMAWKTLFTNKDWDEITIRANEVGKKYTRTTPENGAKLTEKGKAVEEPEKGQPIKKKEENNEIVKYNKFSFRNLWNRFTGLFKHSVDSYEKSTKKEEPEVTTSNPENSQKNEFIEGLRRGVDKEYNEQVKNDIQQQYDAIHAIKEIKVKEDNDPEK